MNCRDAVSGILVFYSGHMSMQGYEQRYSYIFEVTDKTRSSNRSSSKALSRSSQHNEFEVSNSTAKTVFDHTNSKKVYINE